MYIHFTPSFPFFCFFNRFHIFLVVVLSVIFFYLSIAIKIVYRDESQQRNKAITTTHGKKRVQNNTSITTAQAIVR